MSTMYTNDFMWNYLNSQSYREKYGVTIYVPEDKKGKSRIIQAISADDPTLSFNASYDDSSALREGIGNIIQDKIGGNRWVGMAQQALPAAQQTLMGGKVNLADSVKLYSGSTMGSIGIDCIVLNHTSSPTAPMVAIEAGLALTNPWGTLASDLGEGAIADAAERVAAVSPMLEAPLGIVPDPLLVTTNPIEAWNKKNTCTIALGGTLLLTHMICKGFQYTESTQIDPDTKEPVYYKLSYLFEPARAMVLDEVKAWFLQMGEL